MENEKRQDIRSVKQEIDKESDIIENELKQREYVDSGRIRYFSMFTGVGGFDLPLERFGFKCIGFSEIDKCCSELLKRKWPNVKNYGDCTKINPNELPDFDMLCGGFPCQSFSIAGKRRGFQDTRGTMFFEIARILEVKRPKLILLENVKGLLNHDKGETFKVILQTLEELGYRTQWMVLNSKFFGVPQNRERVFIIGSLGTESRPEILPFRKIDKENIKLQGHEEVTNTITSRITADSNGTYIESGGQTQVIHPCITEVIGRQGSSKEYIKSLEKINSIQFDASGKGYKSQQDRVYIPDGVMGTLPNSNPINKLNVAIPVLTPDRLEKRQNGRRFKENGDESFTLTKTDIQTDIHGVMTYDTNDSKPEIGQGKRVYGENRVSPPINQNWQPRIKSELIVHNTQTRSPDRPSLKKNPSAGGSGHIMKVDETYCLDSGNNQAVQLDYKIRRLTPTECERLQGFPDGWTEKGKVFKAVKLFGNIWKDVQFKNVTEKSVIENQNSVLNITKGGENGETLTLSIPSEEGIKESVELKGVIERHIVKNGVCNTINLGKDMVMLSKVRETSNYEEITKPNLMKERMEKQYTYPLWKITLEESSKKEKLSTILTLIKRTILSQTFTCVQTEKPITDVIIVWKKLEQNLLSKESLNLEMENTILMSDTQRYKMMGNAVTVNVIEAIVRRILDGK